MLSSHCYAVSCSVPGAYVLPLSWCRYSNVATGACLLLSLTSISRLVATGRVKNDLLASQCCKMVLAGIPWLVTAAEMVQYRVFEHPQPGLQQKSATWKNPLERQAWPMVDTS